MLRDVVFNVIHDNDPESEVLKYISELTYDAPASAIVAALRDAPSMFATGLSLQCLGVPDQLLDAWRNTRADSPEEDRAMRDIEAYFLACERRERGE